MMDAYKHAITVLDPAPDSPERTGRTLTLIVNGVEFEMTPRASRLSMQELPNGDYVLRLHRSETPAPLMSISTNLLDFALTLDQDKTLVSGVMDLSSVFKEVSSLSKQQQQQPHHKSNSNRRIQRFHVAVPIASDEAVERAIRLHRPLARLKIHGYREVPGPLVVEEAELVLTPVTADILYARTAFLGSELLDGAVPEHTVPSNIVQQELAMIGTSLAAGTKLSTDYATGAGGPCVYLMGRKLACSPSGYEAAQFQSLGPASQTVFAVAFMQFLRSEHGRLASALHDRTLVARLLKAAGSLNVLHGLEALYGGPEQLPTLHRLLCHTSGLPQAFDMTSGDLDAVLAASPKAENARVVLGHDSVEECFGRLLEERCSLVVAAQQRHESPLNYAVLKFMLPNHSVGWAMSKLFESAPKTIRDDHECNDRSVYGAYNGISMTLDSLGWLLGDPAWVPQQWREGSVHTDLYESATQLYSDAWHVPGANAVMGAGNLLLLDAPHTPVLSGVTVGVHGSHICVGVVMPSIGLSAAQFFKTEPSSVPSPALVRRLTLELINRVLSGLKLDLLTLNKPDLLGAMGVVGGSGSVVVSELGEGVELPRQFVNQKMVPLLVDEYKANALAIEVSQSTASGSVNPQLSFVGVTDYTLSVAVMMDADGRTLRIVDPLSKLPAERLGLVRLYSDRAAHHSEHLIQLCGKLYANHKLAHDVLGLLVPGSARAKELYDRQLAAKTRALEHKELYRQMIKPLAIPKAERAAAAEPEPESGSESGSSGSGEEEEQEDEEEQEYESASPEILKQVFDLMLARQRALVDPVVGSALYSGPRLRKHEDLDERGLWATVPERSSYYAQCMAHPVDTPTIPCEPLLSLVAFEI